MYTLPSNVHNKHNATIQVDPTKTMCLSKEDRAEADRKEA